MSDVASKKSEVSQLFSVQFSTLVKVSMTALRVRQYRVGEVTDPNDKVTYQYDFQ